MTDHRWAWTEIDLAAVRHNVRALRGLLAPGVEFMAVVKADAYGHGAVPVAEAAIEAGASALGVATADEALELREAGIVTPILIFSQPPLTVLGELIDADIAVTAYELDFLAALSGEATLHNATAAYHFKVDSGMHRVGATPADAPYILQEAAHLPGLALEGVFTHFATADIPGDWDAAAQLAAFTDTVAAMRSNGINAGVVHACNSPATILMPEAHLDMVRCGLALYGLHPAEASRKLVDLHPVMAVKARAGFVKPVSIGDGVSYGMTWRAFQSTEIATLPLGYADGIPRSASGKMSALVHGQRVPQVGRVCMDQCMFEVPAGEVTRGHEFVLIGEQGGERILMDEVSDAAQTITHETACALGRRLEHVFVDHDADNMSSDFSGAQSAEPARW